MADTADLPVGQQIKLLPMDECYRDAFIEMSMDASLMRYIGEPKTLDQATEDFDTRVTSWSMDNQKWLALAVVDKHSGEFYGDTAIKPIDADAKSAEVGFVLKSSFHGRGIGTETMGLLIDYGFNQLALNKLVAYVDVRNIGSVKALEKCGFLREGMLRQNAFINGEYVDDYVYGLCRSDL